MVLYSRTERELDTYIPDIAAKTHFFLDKLLQKAAEESVISTEKTSEAVQYLRRKVLESIR